MTDANILLLAQIVSATIITVVMLLTKRDVNTLRPQLMTVAEQLVEANKLILQQGNIIQDLHNEIAMKKPTMTTKRFDEDFKASPPYRKPDK